MTNKNYFDVIIIGGSYSGLAAAMALGRSLKQVLIIDSGIPCNRQTPHSHNFITQDGIPPQEIATIARQQVENYDTVRFLDGLAVNGIRTKEGFQIQTSSGETFDSKKIIFATGVRDIMPGIEGFAECWGVSALHCPYCHGYEVRNEKTGILGNGEYGFEFSVLISNWTKDLTLFTNGVSTLTTEQTAKLKSRNINIVEAEIEKLKHSNGYVEQIIFRDGKSTSIRALYSRPAFVQHCTIPTSLGCELSEDGYIKVDSSQKTNVLGVLACGDNTTRMRSVANAVAMGTIAGATVNREIVFEEF
jgi:thioredoxin reductase